MIKPKLAFHAVQAVINDTLHLSSTESEREREKEDPIDRRLLSLPIAARRHSRCLPSLSRLFILTGSISRDIRYASHGHTVTRVILSRLADAPRRFFAAGPALSALTVYTGQPDVYLCSIGEKSAITRIRVFLS